MRRRVGSRRVASTALRQTLFITDVPPRRVDEDEDEDDCRRRRQRAKQKARRPGSECCVESKRGVRTRWLAASERTHQHCTSGSDLSVMLLCVHFGAPKYTRTS